MSNAIAVKTTTVSYDGGAGFVDFAELTDVAGLMDGWDLEDVTSYGASLGHERAAVLKSVTDLTLDVIYIELEFSNLWALKDARSLVYFEVALPSSGSFTFGALISNIEMNLEITNVLRATMTLAINEDGVTFVGAP